MRAVNLWALSQGLETVPSELLASFEAQLCERDVLLDAVKPHEAACVTALVSELRATVANDAAAFEGFLYSFRIPQISSEFDLLKIAEDAVLNIELKAAPVGEDRIRRQLVRNRYYLGPLRRKAYAFTFVLEPRALYELCEDDSLVPVNISRLAEVLCSLGAAYRGRVEDLFRASDYLVSPLNDPQEFLEGKYFLTNHQEHIKTSFLKECAEFGAAVAEGVAPEPPAYLVYGSSGTGKSLLLYDLARSIPAKRPVCVVHCGVLAPGHEELNQAQSKFRVISAKGSERMDFLAFGAVLVDEAQRMWSHQLQSVVASARRGSLPLFLSLDRRQALTQTEEVPEVEQVVRSVSPNLRAWQLSHKIRTNRGLTGFIRTLFGLRGYRDKVRTSHVKIAYAANASQARDLVVAFRTEGYEYIRLGVATSQELALEGCPTTNEVVGQEFDHVVVALGPEFKPFGANTRDEAIYREHVFQGLTRARSDLALVVYQNPSLLAHLLQIVV